MSISKYGSTIQKEKHKANRKLFLINGGILSAITILFLIPAIVFSCVTINRTYETWIIDTPYTDFMKVHTSDFELFRKNSQTLIIDDYTADELGIESGNYLLELPENWQILDEDSYLPLGNNFYGKFWVGYGEYYCHILYKTDDETYEYVHQCGIVIQIFHDNTWGNYDYVLYLPTTSLGEITFVVDGEETDVYYENPLLYFTEYHFVGKNFETNEYGYYAIYYYHAEKLAWTISGIVIGITGITCMTIYFKKRKRNKIKI